MLVPQIKIEYDLEKETKQFLRTLHNPNFLWLRNLIFDTLPELKNRLEGIIDQDEVLEEKTIKEFIVYFREKNKDKINEIVLKSQTLLDEKAEVALTELAKLMDYQWPEDHPGYIVIPTILPNSPFEDNIFYYSILGEIYSDSKNEQNIIFCSIHEISHFILFDILNKNKDVFPKSLDWLQIYYLKEILIAVLMMQEPLAKILQSDNYLGNPDLHQIYVYDKNEEKTIQICHYFKTIYETLRQEDKNFIDILKIFIKLIDQLRDGLNEKFQIWNQHGFKILKDKKLLEKYRKPLSVS